MAKLTKQAHRALVEAVESNKRGTEGQRFGKKPFTSLNLHTSARLERSGHILKQARATDRTDANTRVHPTAKGRAELGIKAMIKGAGKVAPKRVGLVTPKKEVHMAAKKISRNSLNPIGSSKNKGSVARAVAGLQSARVDQAHASRKLRNSIAGGDKLIAQRGEAARTEKMVDHYKGQVKSSRSGARGKSSSFGAVKGAKLSPIGKIHESNNSGNPHGKMPQVHAKPLRASKASSPIARVSHAADAHRAKGKSWLAARQGMLQGTKSPHRVGHKATPMAGLQRGKRGGKFVIGASGAKIYISKGPKMGRKR
jgi:hypothetical protein